MNSTVIIYSPATVANVACGFDVLGLAMEEPGDIISVTLTDQPGINIVNEVEGMNMPLVPEENTTTVALSALVDYLKTAESTSEETLAVLNGKGIEVIFHQKIKPGSGLGSSSASAAAGVYGLNELLGKPLTKRELIPFAMEGERAACGAAHADNVAPAIMGGFTLVRSYHPLDIVAISYPIELFVAIVHPQIEVRTEDARNVLPKEVKLTDAVQQWGNLGGLIVGLMNGDYALIGRALQDVIVEPARAPLIPGYYEAKQAAMEAGALGCNISGSGPSLFALCQGRDTATAVSMAFARTFDGLGIANHVYVSGINAEGVRVI
ncbi:homoserine kinase [soil metagenome]